MKAIWLTIGIFLIATSACQNKTSRGESPAVNGAEQCYQMGAQYTWENNVCVNIAERECYNRTGYIWQNGLCVLSSGDDMTNCQTNGGMWQNGQCVYSNSDYAICRQQGTFQAILLCMQQSVQSFQQLLTSQSEKVRNLSAATSDINTFSSKTTSLMSQGLTHDMSGLKKVHACWDTTSMINQLRQMSTKLQFSDNNLTVRAQAFIDGMHGAAREMQDRINCPLKF